MGDDIRYVMMSVCAALVCAFMTYLANSAANIKFCNVSIMCIAMIWLQSEFAAMTAYWNCHDALFHRGIHKIVGVVSNVLYMTIQMTLDWLVLKRVQDIERGLNTSMRASCMAKMLCCVCSLFMYGAVIIALDRCGIITRMVTKWILFPPVIVLFLLRALFALFGMLAFYKPLEHFTAKDPQGERCAARLSLRFDLKVRFIAVLVMELSSFLVVALATIYEGLVTPDEGWVSENLSQNARLHLFVWLGQVPNFFDNVTNTLFLCIMCGQMVLTSKHSMLQHFSNGFSPDSWVLYCLGPALIESFAINSDSHRD